MAFQLRSRAFEDGGAISKKFTCDGPDVSPELEWTDAPPGTKSFALIVDDPDAPAGTWVHWVLYDLPADMCGLAQGVAKDPELPDGTHQGKNDFGKTGYNGPCPPRGRPHRYFFKLYALDRKLNLKPGSNKSQVERAMTGHILAETQIIGHFQH